MTWTLGLYRGFDNGKLKGNWDYMCSGRRDSLGVGDITPAEEHQTEKHIQHEMETWII